MKPPNHPADKLRIVKLHKCISVHCKNQTSSFYCDECWDRLKAPKKPA
jgi:hypothetical protein